MHVEIYVFFRVDLREIKNCENKILHHKLVCDLFRVNFNIIFS